MSSLLTCERNIPKLIKNPFGNDTQNPGIAEAQPSPTCTIIYNSPKEVKIDIPPDNPIQTVIESVVQTIEQKTISNALSSLFENG